MVIPKKTLMIVAVFALVLGALYVIPAGAFDDGAPTAKVSVSIVKAGQTVGVTAEIPIEPQYLSDVIFPKDAKFTTYNVDVDPVDPEADYRVYFTIETTTSTISGYTGPLDITCTVNGNTASNMDYANFMDNGPIEGTVTANVGQVAVFSHSAVPEWTWFQYVGIPADGYNQIVGADIDGSVFGINIFAVAPDGSSGLTTATVNLNVNEVGSITIEITDIITEVVEP